MCVYLMSLLFQRFCVDFQDYLLKLGVALIVVCAHVPFLSGLVIFESLTL